MARYIEILFRFKVRFALLLVLFPGAAAIVVVALFPTYRASAQLWVDSPNYFGTGNPPGWNQYLTPAQNASDQLGQLLGTRVFYRQLNTRLQSDIPNPADRDQAVYNSKLALYASGSHTLVVTASCKKPPICIMVVNGAIDVLRQQKIEFEKIQAQAGVDYLTKQLKQAQDELQSADDALAKYLSTHTGAKPDADAAQTSPELARLTSNVTRQRNRVNDLQSGLNGNQYTVSISTALLSSGPIVIDEPAVTAGGRLGDGSSLKKAGMVAAVPLGLGLVYLFLLGWVDKTARQPREIEHRLKLPVVATIPELKAFERL